MNAQAETKVVLENQAGWKWYGFPTYHICGARCVFHLGTSIEGKVLVSTVGAFTPDPLRAPYKRDIAGLDRNYETLVFSIDGETRDGDPNVLNWAETLDFSAYQESTQAEAGHYAMCKKWAEKLKGDSK